MLPVWCRLWGLFLSTPSARRATFCGGSGGSGWPISIHALREEGDAYEPFHLREKIEISIHALREEGDPLQSPPCALLSNFYPRPPRGGRQSALSQVIAAAQFLSTPSARRATCPLPTTTRSARFLSTPSARRATPTGFCLLAPCRISIHALREEGDLGELHKQLLQLNFYPRPPRGGRHAHISIPAPFAQFLSTPSARRATAAGCFDGTDKTYFYPRPPRGGRLCCLLLEFSGFRFLSTPSARRATSLSTARVLWISISIHALREEGDGRHPVLCCFGYYFYPRPPRGGRRKRGKTL